MNEISKFLILLRKYRFTLIIVPIVTIIITFFLVLNLPDAYISQAQVATGIVDETQQQVGLTATSDRDKVAQRFSNLMEIMKMTKILDQVSYQLILHDLTAKDPFKKVSKEIGKLSTSEKERVINLFKEKDQNNQPLISKGPNQDLLFKLLKSMEYDVESIKEKLLIYRPGDSDFIVVQFESEDPVLSALVVNLISSEFIKTYSSVLKENQVKAHNFLRDVLSEKSDTLANRMQQLRNYKVENGVLNLSEQSKQLYELVLDYDKKKQEAVEKTASYAGALKQIDRKFNPNERVYIEATLSKVNQSIVNTKDELSTLYNLYISNDLDAGYKKSYDSLNNVLSSQIAKSSDQYITNPYNTKQELIAQKLNLEIQMDMSRFGINSLERKVRSLNRQFVKLVPREADVQKMEMTIDIASKEYLDILNKYNQSSLETSFSTKMYVAQPGIPTLAQPSKKMLLVILSGIICFVFCLLVIFVIYFFDDSLLSAQQLANATELPVVGVVNKLITPAVDLGVLWNKDSVAPHLIQFKNQLRSIRYEIERDLTDKVLLITSIDAMEGKTLISLSLALAWKMTNKKVLIIDGNFGNPSITKASTSKVYLEDFFQGKVNLEKENQLGFIDILGNKGGDTSLLEIVSQEQIESKMNWAKGFYDLIIIETAALDDINQSKEWILFTKNIVSVFEAGSTLTQSKKNHIEYLKETGAFRGWIMNKVTVKQN